MEATTRRETLERYFRRRYGDAVRVRAVEVLGEESGEKGFGYGVPVRVTLEAGEPRLGREADSGEGRSPGPVEQVVIHTVGTNRFGHDTLADRAFATVLAHETFNNLPRHVRSLDMGVMDADGDWISLAGARDFFLITEYAEGEPYFLDLERIARTDQLTASDCRRTDLLADYLAEIHAARHPAPALYTRRIRDLFGHHECILGLLDSYDAVSLDGFTTPSQLREIEHRCLDWRHRLKRFSHRLCRVHGDFHPWNLLWRPDDQFSLLDRSRGEWGEAADDVSCMAINYLFFALQAQSSRRARATPADGYPRSGWIARAETGRLAGPLAELWRRFFERYLAATQDEELPQVIPPFFVWRALVLASPVWYPSLEVEVRRRLFGFIDRLLDVEQFDWRNGDALLAEGPA